MQNNNKIKILVATNSSEIINKIKNNISQSYNIISCFNSLHTLKTILNENISLIILDEKINQEIFHQPLFSFINDISITKDIPIIMLLKNHETILFNNYGINGNSYDLLQLNSNISSLISNSFRVFSSTEDIKNFITSFILALEARDIYSRNHSSRVSKFAAAIAEEMSLSHNGIAMIELAGLFHDIGKIGIPDKILLKPGKLDDDEFNIIKKHPVISEKICSPINYFSQLLPIIRHHHERIDGRGYPDKLVGTDIPLGARIIAVADAFDALTSNRAYRQAFTLERAFNILKEGAGTQWDKEIIQLFLKNFNEKKIIKLLSQSMASNYVKKENLLLGTIFSQKK